MKKYDIFDCKIIFINKIAAGTYDILIKAENLSKIALPGQFAQIYIPGKTLRRPISICEIDKENGTLRFVFQVRGEGTEYLSNVKQGENLNLLAPLGRGFDIGSTARRALFVGGGIGVPPLLAVAQEFGKNAVLTAGFHDKDSIILEDDFKKSGCEVLIATDDGSVGHHGLVTDLFKNLNFDIIFACGPKPMLKAVGQTAQELGIPCQVSMEERMACGVGACLGCAIKLKNKNGEYFGHVCKDGPVFDSREIVWEG